MHKTKLLLSALSLTTLALASGCSSKAVQNQTVAETGKAALPEPTCIGVLPTRTALLDEQSTAANGNDLTRGAQVVDSILRDALGNNRKVRFLDADQIGGLQSPEEMVKLEASQAVAKSVGCSALLETSLSRFVEREGGPMGVQQPAAVTVNYRLYDANTGAVLCHGRFDEQQQAVLDNLFTLGKAGRRGMTWLTGEELAREGLQNRLEECSYLGK